MPMQPYLKCCRVVAESNRAMFLLPLYFHFGICALLSKYKNKNSEVTFITKSKLGQIGSVMTAVISYIF